MEGTDDCTTGSTCNNTAGAYTCDDIDECVEGTDGCPTGTTCEKTDGSFQFTLLPGTCTVAYDLAASFRISDTTAGLGNATKAIPGKLIVQFTDDGADTLQNEHGQRATPEVRRGSSERPKARTAESGAAGPAP